MTREARLAILNKVTDILKNVRCSESVAIDIRFTPEEEFPTINYRIKEYIKFEDTED